MLNAIETWEDLFRIKSEFLYMFLKCNYIYKYEHFKDAYKFTFMDAITDELTISIPLSLPSHYD